MKKTSVAAALLLFVAVPCAVMGATRYTYDELNRLTRVEYDDGRVIAYTYDAAGNLLEKRATVPAPAVSLAVDFTPAAIAALGGSSAGSLEYLGATASGRNRPAAKLTAGYIRIPNRPALQFTEGGTFDLWVRLDSNIGMTGFGGFSTTAWAISVLAKSHDRSGVGFVVLAIDPAYPGSGYGFGSGATYDSTWACTELIPVVRNPAPAIGQWFRLTIAMASNVGYRWYVNKQLVRHCGNARLSFAAMNGQDLFVGRYSDNFWYPLNGAVSDLRVYRKALSEAEVQALE